MSIVRASWSIGVCPNCGKGDWCQQHESGAYMCRRSPGPGLVERLDKWAVPYWVYLPPGAREIHLAPSASGLERAPAEELDRVYKSILSRLCLTDEHRSSLLGRGMTEETINRHFFRSWPSTFRARRDLADSLFREFGEMCRGVPGWYVRDGKPMLAGGSGIAIPMFGLDGGVRAIRIRSDRTSGHKYYWASSGKVGGASSGVHARLAWPGRHPRRDERSAVARITEGEFKSIVLAEATSVPTISVPGVSLWALALPWLRWLRSSKVLLCYDADITSNRDVARAFLSARTGLIRQGLDVAIETWEVSVGA